MISTGIIARVAARITGSNRCRTRPDCNCSHIGGLIRVGQHDLLPAAMSALDSGAAETAAPRWRGGLRQSSERGYGAVTAQTAR